MRNWTLIFIFNISILNSIFALYNNSIINNFSFETVTGNFPSNWTAIGASSFVSHSNTEFYYGYKSLKINDTSIYYKAGARSDAFYLNSDRMYNFAVKCKSTSGTNPVATIIIEFWNGGNFVEFSDEFHPDNNWTTFNIKGMAPLGYNYCRIFFGSTLESVGEIYFDNAGIFVINNAGFENNLSNTWAIHEPVGSYVNISHIRQFYGNNSLEIYINHPSSGEPAYARSSRIDNIKCGERYTLGIQCYIKSEQYKSATGIYDGKAIISLEFWNCKDELISVYNKQTGSKGLWENVTVSGSAPADASYMTVKLSFENYKKGRVYFDNLCINSIGNAGFEYSNNLASWELTEGNYDIFDNFSYEGIRSIKLSADYNASAITNKFYDIVYNGLYCISVKYFPENVSDRGELNVSFYKHGIPTSYTTSINSVITYSWQTASISARIPFDADSAVIELKCINGFLFFDDVQMDEIKEINFTKQLFFDDYVLDNYSAERKMWTAVKEPNPVLVADSNTFYWENMAYIYGTVLKEDGIYKMWYRSIDFPTSYNNLCYAWSLDGITWIKNIPDPGFSDNRCVIYGLLNNSFGIEISSVTKKDSIYYMLGYHRNIYQNKIYSTFSSSDGFVWYPINIAFVDYIYVWNKYCDVGGMIYDTSKNEFVVWTKDGCYNRIFSICSSTDLYYHTALTPMRSLSEGVFDGVQFVTDDVEYYNSIDSSIIKTNCYGLGLFKTNDVYIGFNWQFSIFRDSICGGDDGYVDVQLVHSRDIYKDFQRPFREAVIQRNYTPGWESSMIVTSSTPTLSPNGREVWLYYSGFNGTHGISGRTAAIGLAKWRKDGFISMNAGQIEEIVATKKIICSEEHLLINAKTNGSGNSYIIAEITDENNVPFPGFEKDNCEIFNSDFLNYIVGWNNGNLLTDLIGKTVKINFYLKNADLFSFGFGDISSGLEPLALNEKPFKNNELNISVMPNPSSGNFGFYGLDDIHNVSVYKLTGEHIADYTVNSNSPVIDLSALSSGIYIAKIEVDGNSVVKKLVKK